MVCNSASPYVKDYAGTSIGISDQSFSESPTATSYAMTMKFAAGNAKEFETKYCVRAYAVLSDGSIEYTPVYTYTVYDIASYLYDGVIMPTREKHDYLYNKILLVVNSKYKEKDFDWSEVVVK